jgi:hypothetical protein
VGFAALALVIITILTYAWATGRASSTTYSVTNQRILVVSSDDQGGTSWVGLRELKRIRIRPFGMIDFEHELLPVEQILLREPMDARDRDYTRDAIRNKLIFAGLPDPRSLRDLVQRTVDHLPRRESP